MTSQNYLQPFKIHDILFYLTCTTEPQQHYHRPKDFKLT